MIASAVIAVFVTFSVPAFAADLVITKSQFAEGMKSALPDAFCGDKAYFRKCFTGSKDDCGKEAKTAAASCVGSLDKEIPPQLHQPADGEAWGQKVGACAGERFEKDLAKVKVKSPECDDPEKWK